uniref:hypothetical protein n=1 Tax=Paraburkholderia heleia TaxID=634127 RepID=UPI002AB7128C
LQVLPGYAGRGAAAYLTSPSADGMASLERVISLHDHQMAVTPRYLWLEARERGEHDLDRFLRAARAEEVAAHAVKPG